MEKEINSYFFYAYIVLAFFRYFAIDIPIYSKMEEGYGYIQMPGLQS